MHNKINKIVENYFKITNIKNKPISITNNIKNMLKIGDKLYDDKGKPYAMCCITPNQIQDNRARYIRINPLKNNNNLSTEYGCYNTQLQKYDIPFYENNQDQIFDDISGWITTKKFIDMKLTINECIPIKLIQKLNKFDKKNNWYLPTIGELKIMSQNIKYLTKPENSNWSDPEHFILLNTEDVLNYNDVKNDEELKYNIFNYGRIWSCTQYDRKNAYVLTISKNLKENILSKWQNNASIYPFIVV